MPTYRLGVGSLAVHLGILLEAHQWEDRLQQGVGRPQLGVGMHQQAVDRLLQGEGSLHLQQDIQVVPQVLGILRRMELHVVRAVANETIDVG